MNERSTAPTAELLYFFLERGDKLSSIYARFGADDPHASFDAGSARNVPTVPCPSSMTVPVPGDGPPTALVPEPRTLLVG